MGTNEFLTDTTGASDASRLESPPGNHMREPLCTNPQILFFTLLTST